MTHAIQSLASYRCHYVPLDAHGYPQVSESGQALPFIQIKAPSASWAEQSATHLLARPVAEVVRIEPQQGGAL